MTVKQSKAKTAYALLEDVRKVIVAEPKRYDQTLYLLRGRGERFPSCGTVGCVAGWVVTLTGKHVTARQTDAVAQSTLGLTTEQTWDLFNGGAVPGVPQTKSHARSGAAHIRRFMRSHAKQLKETRL